MTLNAIDLQRKEIWEALLCAKCCKYVFSFHSHRSIRLLQIRKLKPKRLLVCYILFKIICKNKNHKSLLLSNTTGHCQNVLKILQSKLLEDTISCISNSENIFKMHPTPLFLTSSSVGGSHLHFSRFAQAKTLGRQPWFQHSSKS